MTAVQHNQFGKGTVIRQDANNVTVDFNGVIKTLVTKYARLMNEDGTPFGVQAVAEVKKAKKTGAEKRMAWERTLTEEQKRELRFENADGTKNYEKMNDWMEKRERIARATLG